VFWVWWLTGSDHEQQCVLGGLLILCYGALEIVGLLLLLLLLIGWLAANVANTTLKKLTDSQQQQASVCTSLKLLQMTEQSNKWYTVWVDRSAVTSDTGQPSATVPFQWPHQGPGTVCLRQSGRDVLIDVSLRTEVIPLPLYLLWTSSLTCFTLAPFSDYQHTFLLIM